MKTAPSIPSLALLAAATVCCCIWISRSGSSSPIETSLRQKIATKSQAILRIQEKLELLQSELDEYYRFVFTVNEREKTWKELPDPQFLDGSRGWVAPDEETRAPIPLDELPPSLLLQTEIFRVPISERKALLQNSDNSDKAIHQSLRDTAKSTSDITVRTFCGSYSPDDYRWRSVRLGDNKFHTIPSSYPNLEGPPLGNAHQDAPKPFGVRLTGHILPASLENLVSGLSVNLMIAPHRGQIEQFSVELNFKHVRVLPTSERHSAPMISLDRTRADESIPSLPGKFDRSETRCNSQFIASLDTWFLVGEARGPDPSESSSDLIFFRIVPANSSAL